jgi:hypothetical protein
MSSYAFINLDKKGKGKKESKEEPVCFLYKFDRPKLIIDHGIYTIFVN